MIRTNQSQGKSSEPGVGARGAVCWNEDPQAQALRIELNSGNLFVFPLSHFLSAEFTRIDGCDSLNLAFTTHEVRIRGRHLREVALALQKLAVEWIREIPQKYAALADTNAAFVQSIEVSAIGESRSSDNAHG
jgi:hypothetical protein